MKKQLKGFTLALALALVATSAYAEYVPAAGQYDHRVRVANYRDGEVYRIQVSMTHVTSIEFGPGETIRSIIAGDTEGFQLDGVPGGRAFAIKPMGRGIQTNITVYTNQRSYYFVVAEGSGPTHFVVRFQYPDQNVQPHGAVAARSPNYNYGAAGHGEITPMGVWDDGTFTYFQFRPNAPVPAIFRWSSGSERSVNAMAMENDVIRVEGVNHRWVLRLGQQEVCIEAMPHLEAMPAAAIAQVTK